MKALKSTKNTWQPHSVQLEGQTITYALRRSQRKSLGLQYKDTGLFITAPSWASMQQIEKALQAKSQWIRSKQSEHQQRLQHKQNPATVWQAGGLVPFLGTHIHLQLDPTYKTAYFSGSTQGPTNIQTLYLALAPLAESTQIQQQAEHWLQNQAQTHLLQRLHYFLRHTDYGARWTRLRLASPRKRWGSCTSKGVIMLNWRLIHYAPAIIDYVVAHEVAHLKEMNHSALFWQEVERLYPNYRSARQQLRAFAPDDLPNLHLHKD